VLQPPQGWNTYSAETPSATAIESARRFLSIAFALDLEPFSFGAAVVGGVALLSVQR